MSSTHPEPRGITAQEFFARRFAGASMHDAHLSTRLSYSTVHKAGHGKAIAFSTATDLEVWSRKLGLEVFISAVATMGFSPEGTANPVENLTPSPAVGDAA